MVPGLSSVLGRKDRADPTVLANELDIGGKRRRGPSGA